MTSAEPPGAEGSGARSELYTGSDDEEAEDSSMLADLSSMFPALDHCVLVTVLKTHGGDMEATVDYLMALSLQGEGDDATLQHDILRQGLVESEDRYGQFSINEIGGLPEVLPSFMSGNQTDSDSDETEEEAPTNHARSIGNDVNSDEDPLPTYEEAMLEAEDHLVGYSQVGSIMLPVTTSHRVPSERQRNSGPALQQPETQHLTQNMQKKKKKQKKLRKLASKLNIKKSRSREYKAGQERRSNGTPGYSNQPLLQPLVNGDELEENQ